MKASKLVLFFLVSGLLFLMTCKKVEKEMMVTTGSVTEIMITTAKVSGKILDLGEGATQYGHCYSKTTNPTIASTKTELGVPTELIDYMSNLSNLDAATTYYVRAYISKGSEVVYGAEINFTTKSDAKPVLTTTDISSLTKNSATSGGNVTDEGGTPVTARGVCWSLTTGPTADLATKTANGSGTGIFTSNLTGLSNGTSYYVRAYATNSAGTAYGNEISFKTYDIIPTLSTEAVSSITATSAVGNGTVLYNGDASVTARGMCWGTSHNPSLADSWSTNGAGIGPFISNITALNPGTTYFVRAYATNSYGTGYGNEVSFTTLQPPAAITTPASSVITVGATLNGMVNALNYSSVVTFDYGLNTGYGNSKTADQSPVIGNTNTPVSTKITGLTQGETYHFRVKAVSSQGTTYGDDAVFSTVPAKVSDIDGNEYNTWLIGSQVWLLENLRVLHYNNGDPVNTTGTQVDDISAETEPKYQWSYKEALLQYNSSCAFQSVITAGFGNHTLAECVSAGFYTQAQKDVIINWGTKLGLINLEIKWVSQISAECLNTANTLIPESYGRLYTWYAVADNRKLCPAGWHVPTDADWTVLTTYLGGESVAGGKLKEAGLNHWLSPNNGATNESGFTALPVGMHIFNGTFYNISSSGFWWTATEDPPTNVFNREMHYHLSSVLRGTYSKNYGFSVRCLKD